MFNKHCTSWCIKHSIIDRKKRRAGGSTGPQTSTAPEVKSEAPQTEKATRGGRKAGRGAHNNPPAQRGRKSNAAKELENRVAFAPPKYHEEVKLEYDLHNLSCPHAESCIYSLNLPKYASIQTGWNKQLRSMRKIRFVDNVRAKLMSKKKRRKARKVVAVFDAKKMLKMKTVRKKQIKIKVINDPKVAQKMIRKARKLATKNVKRHGKIVNKKKILLKSGKLKLKKRKDLGKAKLKTAKNVKLKLRQIIKYKKEDWIVISKRGCAKRGYQYSAVLRGEFNGEKIFRYKRAKHSAGIRMLKNEKNEKVKFIASLPYSKPEVEKIDYPRVYPENIEKGAEKKKNSKSPQKKPVNSAKKKKEAGDSGPKKNQKKSAKTVETELEKKKAEKNKSKKKVKKLKKKRKKKKRIDEFEKGIDVRQNPVPFVEEFIIDDHSLIAFANGDDEKKYQQQVAYRRRKLIEYYWWTQIQNLCADTKKHLQYFKKKRKNDHLKRKEEAKLKRAEFKRVNEQLREKYWEVAKHIRQYEQERPNEECPPDLIDAFYMISDELKHRKEECKKRRVLHKIKKSWEKQLHKIRREVQKRYPIMKIMLNMVMNRHKLTLQLVTSGNKEVLPIRKGKKGKLVVPTRKYDRILKDQARKEQKIGEEIKRTEEVGRKKKRKKRRMTEMEKELLRKRRERIDKVARRCVRKKKNTKNKNKKKSPLKKMMKKSKKPKPAQKKSSKKAKIFKRRIVRGPHGKSKIVRKYGPRRLDLLRMRGWMDKMTLEDRVDFMNLLKSFSLSDLKTNARKKQTMMIDKAINFRTNQMLERLRKQQTSYLENDEYKKREEVVGENQSEEQLLTADEQHQIDEEVEIECAVEERRLQQEFEHAIALKAQEPGAEKLSSEQKRQQYDKLRQEIFGIVVQSPKSSSNQPEKREKRKYTKRKNIAPDMKSPGTSSTMTEAAAPNTTNNNAPNAQQQNVVVPTGTVPAATQQSVIGISNQAALSAGAAPKRGNSETPPGTGQQAKIPKIGDDIYRSGLIGIAKPQDVIGISTNGTHDPKSTPQSTSTQSLYINTSSSSATSTNSTNSLPVNPLLATSANSEVSAVTAEQLKLLPTLQNGAPFLAAGGGGTIPFYSIQKQLEHHGVTVPGQVSSNAPTTVTAGNKATATTTVSSSNASATMQQQMAAAAAASSLALNGLQFPANAALGSQLAGAALLAQVPPISKKPGKWCMMHVKIANDIHNIQKSQLPSVTEGGSTSVKSEVQAQPQAQQVAPQQRPAQPQQAIPSVGADLAAAAAHAQAQAHLQQQARLAAQCAPSTSHSNAQSQFATFPPPALSGGPQNYSGNPQLMAATIQEAARRVAATPKPANPAIRPPSQQQQNRQQLSTPQQLQQPSAAAAAAAAITAMGLAQPATTATSGGSLTNGISDAAAHAAFQQQQAAQQQQALFQLILQQQQQQQQQQAAQQREQQQRELAAAAAAAAQQQQQQQQAQAQQQQQQAQAQAQAHAQQQQQMQLFQQVAAAVGHQQQQQQQQSQPNMQQILFMQAAAGGDQRAAIAQQLLQQLQQSQQQQQQQQQQQPQSTQAQQQSQFELLRQQLEQQQAAAAAAQAQAQAQAQQLQQLLMSVNNNGNGASADILRLLQQTQQQHQQQPQQQQQQQAQAGRQANIEAILALQQQAQQAQHAARIQGIPGIPAGLSIAQGQPAVSAAPQNAQQAAQFMQQMGISLAAVQQQAKLPQFSAAQQNGR